MCCSEAAIIMSIHKLWTTSHTPSFCGICFKMKTTSKYRGTGRGLLWRQTYCRSKSARIMILYMCMLCMEACPWATGWIPKSTIGSLVAVLEKCSLCWSHQECCKDEREAHHWSEFAGVSKKTTESSRCSKLHTQDGMTSRRYTSHWYACIFDTLCVHPYAYKSAVV